jgi:hypothetical protein
VWTWLARSVSTARHSGQGCPPRAIATGCGVAVARTHPFDNIEDARGAELKDNALAVVVELVVGLRAAHLVVSRVTRILDLRTRSCPHASGRGERDVRKDFARVEHGPAGRVVAAKASGFGAHARDRATRELMRAEACGVGGMWAASRGEARPRAACVRSACARSDRWTMRVPVQIYCVRALVYLRSTKHRRGGCAGTADKPRAWLTGCRTRCRRPLQRPQCERSGSDTDLA